MTSVELSNQYALERSGHCWTGCIPYPSRLPELRPGQDVWATRSLLIMSFTWPTSGQTRLERLFLEFMLILATLNAEIG